MAIAAAMIEVLTINRARDLVQAARCRSISLYGRIQLAKYNQVKMT